MTSYSSQNPKLDERECLTLIHSKIRLGLGSYIPNFILFPILAETLIGVVKKYLIWRLHNILLGLSFSPLPFAETLREINSYFIFF